MSLHTRSLTARSARRTTCRGLGAALLLASVLAVPAWVAAPAAAAGKPDLRVTALRADAARVAPGGELVVTDTTANTKKRKAGRSVTRFYLSTDRKASKKDLVLGSRRVKRLAGRADHTRRTTLTVPSGTAERAWWLLACADATEKVRESREGNNCRAAAAQVEVAAEPAGPSFPQEPDPFTVGSTLQTDRAVTKQVFPHETTQLTAQAADGTSYTLTIPPDALLGPVQITMTPVASVSGLPLSGGLVAGVQLEPHGLALFAPVELEITSPDAGPLAQQTPFLFHEDGEDFHLYAPDLPEAGDDPDTVRMTLDHFSTPGLGLGTAADRAGMADHPPARTLAQVEAAVSGLIAAERASQLAGNPPDDSLGGRITAILESYYHDSLRPRLVEAENSTDLNEADAALLIAEALSLARQLALMGGEDGATVADIMQRVERITRAVMNSAWQDCLEHDYASIPVLLRTARISQLFGYAWQAEAMDKLRGCATFEVRFDSSRTSVGSYSGTLQSGEHDEHFRLTSTVLVPFLSMDARAPLTHAEFHSFSSNTIHDADPDCTSTTTGVAHADGQLLATVVPFLDPTVLESQAGAAPPQPDVMATAMVPGDAEPTQTYRYVPCNGAVETHVDSLWSFVSSDHELPVTLSPTRGNDLVGTHHFADSETTDGDTTSVETLVEVWHRPQS